MTAEAAIRLKGLPYERVDLPMNGEHPERMQELYGEGHSTVPGLLVDGEPVHGSRAILERLEKIEPERRVRSQSQLDLAGEANTTPRYVSFVETGRARASRLMIVRLARPGRSAERAKRSVARRGLRAAVLGRRAAEAPVKRR